MNYLVSVLCCVVLCCVVLCYALSAIASALRFD